LDESHTESAGDLRRYVLRVSTSAGLSGVAGFGGVRFGPTTLRHALWPGGVSYVVMGVGSCAVLSTADAITQPGIA